MKPKPTFRYENILRAIGQGLEKLNVKSLRLEISDGHYVVSGKCRDGKPTHATKSVIKKAFLRLVQTVRWKKAAPEPFQFTGLRFTRRDIDLLDRTGKFLRLNLDRCPPNLHSISHVLRMTGAYLDHADGLLLKLSWRHGILTLWSINGLGAHSKEEFTLQELYDLWVHQFKKRRLPRILMPTGSD